MANRSILAGKTGLLYCSTYRPILEMIYGDSQKTTGKKHKGK